VGGDAQRKAMKKVGGRLKLELSQFRALAAFAQFGSDLDKSTQQQLERGLRLTELLKQQQYQPLSLAEEVIMIFAATRGYMDKVPVNRVKEYQTQVMRFINTQYPAITTSIQSADTKYDLTADAEKSLQQALDSFNASWS
jgi:F-type H+/Na+-transporting ATPase subunit alpha